MKSNSQITFQKAYGGVGEETNECLNKSTGVLCKTNDNGYAIFNSSNSFTTTIAAYLVRTKQNGDTNFTRAYLIPNGPSHHCIGRSVKQNPDGGFILGVWFNGYYNNGTNGQGLIRTNSSGDTLWCRRFATTYTTGSMGYFGTNLSDNSFISCGFANNSTASLCRVTSSGTLIFGRRYFLNSINSEFNSSTETNDGGIISTGCIKNYTLGLNSDKILIAKTDKLGNLKWAKAYNNGYTSYGSRLIELSDKSIVTIGYQQSHTQTDRDIIVIKTDSIGNTLFNKVICDSLIQYGCSLSSDAQDNIFLVGYSGYMGSVVIKMSSNGNVLFKKEYPLCDVGNDIVSTNDNGFAFSGMTPNLSNNGTDLYLVKADSLGDAGCSTNDCTLTVSNGSYSMVTIPLSSANDLVAYPINLSVKSGGIVSTMCYNEPINTHVVDLNQNVLIQIFPNPTNRDFTIQTNSSEIQILKLFDLNGRLIFTKSISDEVNIDISNLREGVYNLSLQNSAGSINKKLIVVK